MKNRIYSLFICFIFSTTTVLAQDAMFINSAGNVGIGTNSPTNKLSVEGSANFTGNVGIGTAAPSNKLSVNGNADFTGDVGIKSKLTTKTLSVNGNADFTGEVGITEKLTTKNLSASGTADFSGNVGIGTKTPSKTLDVQGKIGILAGNHNDPTIRGLGGSSWTRIGGNSGGLAFWGNDRVEIDDSPAIFVTNEHNVGIGTISPKQGKLVVNGFQKTFITEELTTVNFGSAIMNWYLYTNVKKSTTKDDACRPILVPTKTESNCSVYATNSVVASEFNAFSDSRIKTDFQKSDIAQDLETLRKLQITDYYYKDGLQHGFAQKKGIIAQEVEAVFPQAVNKHSDYITDIFAMPINTNLVENTLTVSMEKEHGLKNGDKVRLITPNEVAEVEIEVVDNKGFMVKNWDKKTSEVFVYGKLVDDFRSVDFDRLTILSISGVQQLCKEMEAMKAENLATKKTLSSLEARINKLEAKEDSASAR